MQVKNIPFDTISLDLGEIYRSMGYANSSGEIQPCDDSRVTETVEELMGQVAAICRPQYTYRLVPITQRNTHSVTLGDTTLTTGGILTNYLKDAEYLAVFVATAGAEFDRWLHDLKSANDILQEFIGDAIGSEIPEATARTMIAELEDEAAQTALCVGNSYSPGYCGWHVKDQQALFSLLSPQPCGITLNDSSLMSPIKSVSGILPVGHKVVKMPYGCQICGKKDCYKKRISI